MLIGVTVPKHYLTNYRDFKIELSASLLILVMMLMPINYFKSFILGWDNLETRRQKLKAEMVPVYKSLNGLAPNYLSSIFIQRSDVITAYNLRDSDGKLAIPLPRPNYYKNSFGYSGAVLWNSLPSAARQATSLTSFR